MSREEIKDIIKQKILIERLELEDIEADEIVDTDPLFGEGIGLDSVEALDVVVGVREEFNIELPKMSEEETHKHFYSVESLAEFIETLLQDENK